MKDKEKIQKIMIISIICISIIIISLIAYSLNASNSNQDIESDEIQESTSEFESASTEIGKSIEEAEEEYETASVSTDEENSTNNTANNTSTNSSSNNVASNTTKSEDEETTENEDEDTSSEEEVEETVFEAPIKGEIIREFAIDSLVYSDTLKEWITHTGIDIQADKTSVVSAAAAGIVYAIKDDPRYGLTVIVNHSNDYQTIYSNLLTAEFVVEGEEITLGQTIGTVGNSAAFEISDDYHLHFELLQDGEYLDPTIYMNFE